jgi:hypothetical protein
MLLKGHVQPDHGNPATLKRKKDFPGHDKSSVKPTKAALRKGFTPWKRRGMTHQ